jgi:mRNA-degrading endonuclease RelE of RelBE toxin-antitoxin system
MHWAAEYTPTFKKDYKSLGSQVRARADEAVAQLLEAENPAKLGLRKVGRWKGVYSYEIGRQGLQVSLDRLANVFQSLFPRLPFACGPGELHTSDGISSLLLVQDYGELALRNPIGLHVWSSGEAARVKRFGS